MESTTEQEERSQDEEQEDRSGSDGAESSERSEGGENGGDDERNLGRIEEIQGVVVEAVFPDSLPALYGALSVQVPMQAGSSVGETGEDESGEGDDSDERSGDDEGSDGDERAEGDEDSDGGSSDGSASNVTAETQTLILEVQQHIGDDRVRAVAMGGTDGLTRGTEVTDTGGPITVPVGQATLGRVFNLLGEPIDEEVEFV